MATWIKVDNEFRRDLRNDADKVGLQSTSHGFLPEYGKGVIEWLALADMGWRITGNEREVIVRPK